MRKPRDFDAELKALNDKAAMLKARKVQQLGELVIATQADALDPETLTGALLDAAKTKDTREREAWRVSGAAFFQGQSRGADRAAAANTDGNHPNQGNGEPR